MKLDGKKGMTWVMAWKMDRAKTESKTWLLLYLKQGFTKCKEAQGIIQVMFGFSSGRVLVKFGLSSGQVRIKFGLSSVLVLGFSFRSGSGLDEQDATERCKWKKLRLFKKDAKEKKEVKYFFPFFLFQEIWPNV